MDGATDGHGRAMAGPVDNRAAASDVVSTLG